MEIQKNETLQPRKVRYIYASFFVVLFIVIYFLNLLLKVVNYVNVKKIIWNQNLR